LLALALVTTAKTTSEPETNSTDWFGQRIKKNGRRQELY